MKFKTPFDSEREEFFSVSGDSKIPVLGYLGDGSIGQVGERDLQEEIDAQLSATDLLTSIDRFAGSCASDEELGAMLSVNGDNGFYGDVSEFEDDDIAVNSMLSAFSRLSPEAREQLENKLFPKEEVKNVEIKKEEIKENE